MYISPTTPAGTSPPLPSPTRTAPLPLGRPPPRCDPPPPQSPPPVAPPPPRRPEPPPRPPGGVEVAPPPPPPADVYLADHPGRHLPPPPVQQPQGDVAHRPADQLVRHLPAAFDPAGRAHDGRLGRPVPDEGLRRREALPHPPHQLRRHGVPAHEQGAQAGVAAAPLRRHLQHAAHQPRRREIGRASCRERV